MADRRARLALGTPSVFMSDVSEPTARAPTGMGPGARGGQVSVLRRGQPTLLPPLDEELNELLEFVCHGEPLGPALARRAEREARALLLRRGFATARLAAMIDRGAVVLQVELPPDVPRVRSFVVRVGR